MIQIIVEKFGKAAKKKSEIGFKGKYHFLAWFTFNSLHLHDDNSYQNEWDSRKRGTRSS